MSITSSNVIVMLAITNLFPAPQQIKGFASDDVFATDPVSSAEVVMGVDGLLSGGYVNVPTMQNITLQADSLSNEFFDTWRNFNKSQGDLYTANGIIKMPSLGKTFVCTKGFLTQYQSMSDAKRILQPRRYQITWESVDPAQS